MIRWVHFLAGMALLLAGLPALSAQVSPGNDLLTEVYAREKQSLDGKWHYIVDPTENGYYDYRRQPYKDEAESAYFSNTVPRDKGHRVEYDFSKSPVIMVPGDWNSQINELLWYEGTVWYQRSFNFQPVKGNRTFLYFGGANYETTVYVNGQQAGHHIGGFTPFSLEVSSLLEPGENDIVVKVDNTRRREAVPTVAVDWWNYGGITRSVYLVQVPQTYIADYALQMSGNGDELRGYVRVERARAGAEITVRIPELNIEEKLTTNDDGIADIILRPRRLQRWTTSNPKRYEVTFTLGRDQITDHIGFRTISVEGQDILLNGEKIFLKGICAHEENPMEGRRSYSEEDAHMLMRWMKELNGNFIRLAHYPHNEHVPRIAEEEGILLWEEIPVYWTIDWENEQTLDNARTQLSELIRRDKNRASVILWSMANETPVSEPRNDFLRTLATQARELDTTRLITAALEMHQEDGRRILDDPFGEYLDVISFNQYHGWYGGDPDDFASLEWEIRYDKPVLMSEWGGGALYGYHADEETVWSEEYQAHLYSETLEGVENIPGLSGMTPWILTDFRSPRRPLAQVQDYWNLKGIISRGGHKKMAFYILQAFYQAK